MAEATFASPSIAVWRQDIRQHRLYLTSTDPSQLNSDSAPAVYALRWEIELLFRELKSQLKLEEMPSGNKSATECLIYAALLTLGICCKHSSNVQVETENRERSSPLLSDGTLDNGPAFPYASAFGAHARPSPRSGAT
jgi:hypothetical protein